MGRITIDMSGSSIVPPGDYLVEVQHVTLCDKNDGSSQFLRVDLLAVDGAHVEARFDTVISLHPDYAGLAMPMLEALGVELNGSLEIDYEEVLCKKSKWGDEYERVVKEPDLLDRRAVASVIHREFGDQTYVRVRRLKAVAS